MSGTGGNWTITPHACRWCLSRVLQQGHVFRCSTCGRTGNRTEEVCGCGLVPPGHKKPVEGGYRCAANPTPSVTDPAEVVIVFGNFRLEPARA